MERTVDPLIGTTIAERYHIVARIGAGAMGAVYRAEQAGLERPVALKVLRQDAAFDATTVARFQREARAMSALTHPNTVRVFDFGSTREGMLFLAMELLHGELASERLRRGRVHPLEALGWVRELLESIGEAHDKKIIHRDLKPDNLFLARTGDGSASIRVLDFGIAKAIEGERTIDQFETLDGTVFGTPRYMSPEQASGKPLDHRSDLYAVGIILYELLTGRPPFVDKDAVVVMAKHIREKPAPLRKAAPQALLPGSLERVVERALQKSPEQRFQSASEFAAALAACEPQLRAAAMESGARRALSLRRWPVQAKLALLAMITAALLAVVILLVIRSDRGPTAPDRAQPRQGRDNGVAQAEVTASDETRDVTLQTEPEGAAVWRDGEKLGVTPLRVAVPANQDLQLELRKQGFATQTIDLSGDRQTRLVELERKPRPEPSSVHKDGGRKGGETPREDGQSKPAANSPYEKFR